MTKANNKNSLFSKVKLILKSVREYKKYAIITPLFMIGEVAMECSLPFIMSLLLGQVELLDSSTGIAPLIPYILLLIGMAVISLVCGIMGGVFGAKASTGLAKNLRGDLYRKLQSFSFENIDKFSNASLVPNVY